MDRYRAEARRTHNYRTTTWRGKWRPDPTKAIEQAIRWQQKEPLAEISVVAQRRLEDQPAGAVRSGDPAPENPEGLADLLGSRRIERWHERRLLGDCGRPCCNPCGRNCP